MSEAKSVPPERMTIALAQYRECSAHHIHFMTMIWQVPAVTVTITGALLAVAFAYDVPDAVRALIVLLGAMFIVAMTVAVDRYRMFQLRRRQDLARIETELAALGAERIAWNGADIVAEIRAGTFDPRGVRLYRWEGFRFLQAVMYAASIVLAVLLVLAVLEALGLEAGLRS